MNNINYKTYAQLATDIRRVAHRIPKDIDLVVGIPRSGMIPAHMIGTFLNIPVASLNEFIAGVSPLNGERPLRKSVSVPRRILVVDDTASSGAALAKVRAVLAESGRNEVEYVFFAAYVTAESVPLVDLYAEVLAHPRMFQWNYLNHEMLGRACVDIDGVLCNDPSDAENDDGERYLEFIRGAKPLYVPWFPVKALVTSRLEKYRKPTEEWLAANGVKYERLYMLDLPDKETRIRTAAHGAFKAETYEALSECVLFIESQRNQAVEIFRRTGKPVICVGTDEMFTEDPGGTDSVLAGHTEGLERLLTAKESELEQLRRSKSFRIGNLFFRTVPSPLKWITFPVNLFRIIFCTRPPVPSEMPSIPTLSPADDVPNRCPICGFNGVFENSGDPVRFRVRCPRCGSLERHRFLFFLYRISFLGGEERKRVLHMAPEKCLQDLLIKSGDIEYSAADLDPTGYEGLACEKQDFVATDYENNLFDVILSNHVLEHILNESKFFQELNRILKDDGMVVLGIPYAPGLRKTYEDESITTDEGRRESFGQYDHVRLYGEDASERFRRHGFHAQRVDVGIFPGSVITEYGLRCPNPSRITDAFFILRKRLKDGKEEYAEL